VRATWIFIIGLLAAAPLWAQTAVPPKTQIMTLGVFHFAYHNLDVKQTPPEDQINVLDAPYQDEIQSIADALARFHPTVIAVEADPKDQAKIDSLYAQYKAGEWEARRGEIYQLGFRLARMLKLGGVRCVNNWGRAYPSIQALLKDPSRVARLENYVANSTGSVYRGSRTEKRVRHITDTLIELNNPRHIYHDLAIYLVSPFKYEEKPGDFTGVDFETGRWFSRNLRIFRNLQRLPHGPDDRILVIFGAGHLNLLNFFIDVSPEYELVSPLPYLKQARDKERASH
jgi:hypothetical protein